MPTTCCVVGCNNTTTRDRDRIHFFSFPGSRNPEQHQLWISAIKRDNPDGTRWNPTKHHKVCSAHFVGDKWSPTNSHPDYVPSIFPTSHLKKKSLADQKRFERHFRRQEAVGGKEGLSTNTAITESTSTGQEVSGTLQEFEEKLLSKKIQVCPVDLTPVYDSGGFQFTCTFEAKNVSTQATIPSQKNAATETLLPDQVQEDPVDFLSFSTEQFKAVTGIEKNLFFVIIDALKIVGSKLKNSQKLSKEQKVLLCLVKLKLNLSFTSLGALFCVSRVSASAWFDCTLKELTKVARLGVVWFDRATINARMPASFKALFPQTRCIIDCSEVYCEKPKSQKQHVLLYSHYKSHCTIKFLVACAPSGEIVFLSHAFGGRSTDAQITVKSGFLNLIEQGDVILADKGFPQIEESLNKAGAVIVMPPHKVGNRQFSNNENIFGYKCASVRIHVERCIGRMKNFQVLHFLELPMLKRIDDILYVIAFLVNNSNDVVQSKP